ncbi:endonuclease/exonuclease/phosphatase family protein [Amycolatopsis suaedae]|uniref:Endonuclease/exonuclease/phosphatase domain-containing protein n=1 Tax=Amycolatopsis suaedae TaxID=2510978 RepID=A0A4Q7JF36_9PSEU|nr:endonuclease/exonuclease/phosphatase family protein [Amycolatopsis suaedae]RZQ65782.1 hypothetical protein EWH70_01475 [Amycolatopsis suaedae]
MRILTLNLWARYGDWTARRVVLAERLRELAPDVVAFQESVRTGGYDQVADLLGDDYTVVHQEDPDADGRGSAIASRLPIGQVRQFRMPATQRVDLAEFAAWVGMVEVLGPSPIWFVNHKPSYRLAHEHERELQAVFAARLIERTVADRDLPVVVAGDFDATPDAASMRFWRGLQSLCGTSVRYRDVWEWLHPGEPGHTYSAVNPLVVGDGGRRLDYLLVRETDAGPGLLPSDCRLVFDVPRGRVWASDHFGVTADLRSQELVE